MKKLTLLFLIIINLNAFSQETIDLFIWAGQSNALGRQGDAAQYPADVDNLDSQIRFNWTVPNGSNSSGWTTMEPQDLGHYFPAGHFGAEVTFSRKLKQAGYNPAIFKYTQGATSIFQHWLNPGGTGLYDSMVTELNTAITTLENQGHTVNIRGLIWIQGESDSNSDDSANAYFNNLTILLNDFRTNVVNDTELPIILGVDEQFFNLVGHERHQILNAHQDIALNDANIKFTSMYGYPKADVTHLTPAGLISHGEDLFDSYQLLISGEYPSDNCVLTSVGNHSSFDRTSWGQSFTTDCSGMLSSLTFEAITLHNSTATFTLYDSADCSGTSLLTKTLNLIDVGDNAIDLLTEGIYLEKEHTYYFDIVSDTDTAWGINFSDTNDANDVFGVLRCTSDDGTANCGRTFLDFDMDFSIELVQESTCSVLSSGSEVSFERASWGQSFSTACTGNLNSITFSAASALNENATFYLYDGIDCNATEIFTQSLSEIVLGNNTVDINVITLDENNTYFFQVISDNDTFWRIHYSNTNIVDGILHTFQNGNYCEREFPSFDMNFSVAIGNSNSSCANDVNIYSFVYNDVSYEIVKENKTWINAVNCAVERGGFLVEINNQAEQDAIFNELQNANINLANTIAVEGGGASYAWIGGNDMDVNGTNHEGQWVWNGNNDTNTTQFWLGDTNGNPVGGLYSNWGTEPDNSGGIQDALSIALTQWPINAGNPLGIAGQWNDLDQTNTLYYIIEYGTNLGVNENNIVNVKIYPNPVKDILIVENSSYSIASVKIITILGQELKNIEFNTNSNKVEIDFSNINSGTYFVKVNYTNGDSIVRKVIR